MFNFFQKQRAKASGKALAKLVLTMMEKADAGDPEAQFQLGIQFEQGQLGFPQDYSEAARLYRKAAEQGLAGAQLYLGVFYANGQGVPKDPIEAYKWLELAKKGNEQDSAVATECQEQLIAHLSDRQIAEGNRRANAFMISRQ